MHNVYLSLGSNMGDRKTLIDEAVKQLGSHMNITVLGQSAYYETAPWGGVEQEAFLNIALKIETTLSPLLLLDECQRIELRLNRERHVRWGPRTIDIDILIYDDIKIDHNRLEVPHPRMFERAFVLIPLKDIITEDTCYGHSIESALSRIEDQEIKKL